MMTRQRGPQSDQNAVRRRILANACAAAFSRAAKAYATNRSAALDAVTELRWRNPGYAWCGDLVTYVLEQAGLQRGLNRKAIAGKWNPGQNITMLMASVKERRPSLADAQPWDVVVLKRPSGNHVGFFNGLTANSGFSTADGNGPLGGIGFNERAPSDRPLAIIPLEAFSLEPRVPIETATPALVGFEYALVRG